MLSENGATQFLRFLHEWGGQLQSESPNPPGSISILYEPDEGLEEAISASVRDALKVLQDIRTALHVLRDHKSSKVVDLAVQEVAAQSGGKCACPRIRNHSFFRQCHQPFQAALHQTSLGVLRVVL